MNARVKWVTAGALVALATTATVATSLAGTETVQACAKIESGQLRLVAEATECLPSETAISWSSTSGGGTTEFTRVSATVAPTAEPVTATCPTGSQVVGGGGHATPITGGNVIATYPASDTSWSVTVMTNMTATSVSVYAVCAG